MKHEAKKNVSSEQKKEGRTKKKRLHCPKFGSVVHETMDKFYLRASKIILNTCVSHYLRK